MPKFRKRPVVIEAEQWFAGQDPETYPECVVWDYEVKGYTIVTLEGVMRVSDGDWVITGVHGEKYPCKPDIFEKTYELVED